MAVYGRHLIRTITPVFPTLPRHPLRAASPTFSSSPAMAAPLKVLVPIANGTEPIEAAVIEDVLRRAGADVSIASVHSSAPVGATWGVNLLADVLISELSDSHFDLISLPGGMPGAQNLRESKVLEGILKKHAEEGRVYSAICASPAVVLGPLGLLKGLKATCYPSWMDKLPADMKAVEDRVVKNGRVVTSRGPGTTMEFGLALVEELYGKEKANEVAGPLVMRPEICEHSIKEFNPIEWTFNKTPQVLVPIANASEEIEALTIIDVLRRAGASVVVASIEETVDIVARRELKIVADMLFDEACQLEYDLILLPGGLGGAQSFSKCEKLVNLLKKQRDANKFYGAICASPAYVLEPHGLLKGKKATAFPPMCHLLTDQSEIENRVVVDGNLITSRGPGTAMEFALSAVEKLFGREKAIGLAKTMVFI